MKNLLLALLFSALAFIGCKKETVEPEVPVEEYTNDRNYIASTNWIVVKKYSTVMWKLQDHSNANVYIFVKPQQHDINYVDIGDMLPGGYVVRLETALKPN